VDDGSTDDTRAIAESFNVTILSLPQGPHGPAFARNAGAQAATHEILFFVDADVLIRPDTLGHIAESFRSDPDLAAVFGSYDENPAAHNFVSQYKNLFHHFVHQRGYSDAATFWSGCGAIRHDIFNRMGGFDAARYPRPSIEDIELGSRLKAAGYRIKLDRSLQVKHLKKWTLGGLVKCDILYRAVPWTKLIFERRDMPNDLNLQLSQRISSLLLCALLALIIIMIPLHPVLAALPLLVAVFLLLVGYGRWYDERAGTRGSARAMLGITMVAFASAGAFVLLQAPAWLAAVLAVGFGTIVFLNREFYRFFGRLRGVLFAAAVIPFHLLYYLYSVVGLALGLLATFATKRQRAVTEPTSSAM
jgi:cellulose synthase/poly-beta-1,6-N-acetylglucosamine synthase-like glycosyltransferase